MTLEKRQFPTQTGATLVFMIVTISVMGSMLLMYAFRPTRDFLREQQTQRKLSEVREALIGYATQHGRLPRPASSATEGSEKQQLCETTQSCTGFIPWVTLGIDGTDSWGKVFRYSVTPSFTVRPIQAVTSSGDKTVRARAGNGALFYIAGQAGCPIYVECPPAIIYSSGKNVISRGDSSTTAASHNNDINDEYQNSIATNDFIKRPYSTAQGQHGGDFDDLITWIPTQLLYARMRAAHML